MGQEATATGNWRVNNSPTIKRVAKRQQTMQKSKCQLAAQGYNNARTITYYQSVMAISCSQDDVTFILNHGRFR
jgi:hypothetical protein